MIVIAVLVTMTSYKNEAISPMSYSEVSASVNGERGNATNALYENSLASNKNLTSDANSELVSNTTETRKSGFIFPSPTEVIVAWLTDQVATSSEHIPVRSTTKVVLH
jgi:hypothetical protein